MSEETQVRWATTDGRRDHEGELRRLLTRCSPPDLHAILPSDLQQAGEDHSSAVSNLVNRLDSAKQQRDELDFASASFQTVTAARYVWSDEMLSVCQQVLMAAESLRLLMADAAERWQAAAREADDELETAKISVAHCLRSAGYTEATGIYSNAPPDSDVSRHQFEWFTCNAPQCRIVNARLADANMKAEECTNRARAASELIQAARELTQMLGQSAVVMV